MLCQACKKREALIHISTGSTPRERNLKSKHFCRECADAYYARTPGMNSARDLIRLSDFYRSKLYDELEAKHPEAFDNSDDEACRRGSDVMRGFLKERLTKDNIKLNADGLEMLCHDFFGSRHFYDRIDKRKSRKSTTDDA
jgi:protein-arginine kinase activator protein McsA